MATWLRRTAWLPVACACALAFACKIKDEPSSMENFKKKADGGLDSVESVNPPVPQGTKIPCDKMFDLARLSTALGKEVVLDPEKGDITRGTFDVTTACSFTLGGEKPKPAEYEKRVDRSDVNTGLMPGDEMCVIKVFCAFNFRPEEMKKTCESGGETVSTEFGDPTCTKVIVEGPYDRYVISALDGDTKCKFSSHQGERITQVDNVKLCLRAAMDVVGPENLKTQ